MGGDIFCFFFLKTATDLTGLYYIIRKLLWETERILSIDIYRFMRSVVASIA